MAKYLRALVALFSIIVSVTAFAATEATAYLPMARKGEVSSPKVLAERIRESLTKDANGNVRVRGANTTPVGFLTAVQKAGGAVDGVQALPLYLESLIERDMPSGMLTMSRVKYTRDAAGTEQFVLDVEKGFTREAHQGERGWFDPNTGNFILAGDCGNSPLGLTKGPVATPAPVLPPPPEKVVAGCTDPLRLRLNIWEAKALQVAGVSATREATKPVPASWFEPDRVSRKYGKTFRAMNERGELERSIAPHRVIVTHVRAGAETVLFEGAVVGSSRDILMPKDLHDDDVVKVTFPDHGKLWSPLKGDLRGKGYEFVRGTCGARTNFHAIEK